MKPESKQPFSIEVWRLAALQSNLHLTGAQQAELARGLELLQAMTGRLHGRDCHSLEPINIWHGEERP